MTESSTTPWTPRSLLTSHFASLTLLFASLHAFVPSLTGAQSAVASNHTVRTSQSTLHTHFHSQSTLTSHWSGSMNVCWVVLPRKTVHTHTSYFTVHNTLHSCWLEKSSSVSKTHFVRDFLQNSSATHKKTDQTNQRQQQQAEAGRCKQLQVDDWTVFFYVSRERPNLMCTMKELACSMSYANFDKFTVYPLLQWPLGVTRKRLDGQRLKWFHRSSFAVMQWWDSSVVK